MKKNAFLFVLIIVIISLSGCKSSKDPSSWSSSEIDGWFAKHEWLNGWTVAPDASINKKEFVAYYFKNKERWDKAFAFLKDNDLAKLEVKRYDIDGDNLYASVSESMTKNEEDSRFEAHHKYIDIQHVINGAEQMSITPLSDKKEELVPYDPAKDVEFMTVNATSSYEATPDNFFIFFPSDIHRPSVKIGENKLVRKVVVKVKID
ncbi:MAG: YhcH/YjgK/YiaL family protein [Bacteroidales bacterium]|nr:YhcH/YjgK/YiaL family protein [Bacteroidales bacterium]